MESEQLYTVEVLVVEQFFVKVYASSDKEANDNAVEVVFEGTKTPEDHWLHYVRVVKSEQDGDA